MELRRHENSRIKKNYVILGNLPLWRFVLYNFNNQFFINLKYTIYVGRAN